MVLAVVTLKKSCSGTRLDLLEAPLKATWNDHQASQFGPDGALLLKKGVIALLTIQMTCYRRARDARWLNARLHFSRQAQQAGMTATQLTIRFNPLYLTHFVRKSWIPRVLHSLNELNKVLQLRLLLSTGGVWMRTDVLDASKSSQVQYMLQHRTLPNFAHTCAFPQQKRGNTHWTPTPASAVCSLLCMWRYDCHNTQLQRFPVSSECSDDV